MAQALANPANKAGTEDKTRIPFTTPIGKLAVPEIPGYVLYWFLGTQQRIERALKAGYEYVDTKEVILNDRTLGSAPATDGNTDLGSQVSQIAGTEIGPDGQAIRLILMKIKKEYWDADQAALFSEGSRLEGVRRGLLGGLIGQEGLAQTDRAQTYLDAKRTKIPDFLKRKA